jgi:UDP-glucose:(heptosyl)LPS alpha-1,3-glucosyltransferase
LGIEARVRFFGGQQDVRPFYAAADVFCLPTLYDPFPNAALEALACGLPVVTSTTSGVAELIQPGTNGHVCPARDVPSLARQLDALCDYGMAQSMRESARATVLDLDWTLQAGRLAALYQSLS